MATPQQIFGNPPVPTSAGPCILGMGYCSPVTNNVLQSVNESLTTNIQSQLSTVANSMGAVVSQTQIINFSNDDFSLCPASSATLDISQNESAQINMTMVTAQMTQQKLTQLVGAALAQTQTDGTSSSNGFFSGGNNADTLNLQQTFNQSINNLSNSVTLEQFNTMSANVTQLQSVNFSGLKVAGQLCNINNISQNMTMTLLAQMMSNQVTSTLASMVSKSTLDAVQKDSTSNISTGPLQDIATLFSSISSTYMILIIGVILVLIIVGMVFSMMRHGQGDTEEITTTEPLRNEIGAMSQ